MISELFFETGWIYIYIYITRIHIHRHMHFPKNCKLCKLSWIQDSRFWEKLPESGPGQSALGFKKFFPESWILNQKKCKFANFPGFKIQDSRFWGKLLESRPGFGSKKFFLESWILNPQKIASLQTFLDSRFKILGETPWIQALFWIQEVFLRILNLESQKKCKFASGGNSLNPGLVLDSRSFSQNLEFWILNPKKNANFANFAGFKIRDSRFWEKLPESRPWLNKRYVRGIVVCSGSIKWYIN